MTDPLERRRWAIAGGYIPGASTGPAPEVTSHETVNILNVENALLTTMAFPGDG